jgi:hypothetical protein
MTTKTKVEQAQAVRAEHTTSTEPTSPPTDDPDYADMGRRLGGILADLRAGMTSAGIRVQRGEDMDPPSPKFATHIYGHVTGPVTVVVQAPVTGVSKFTVGIGKADAEKARTGPPVFKDPQAPTQAEIDAHNAYYSNPANPLPNREARVRAWVDVLGVADGGDMVTTGGVNWKRGTYYWWSSQRDQTVNVDSETLAEMLADAGELAVPLAYRAALQKHAKAATQEAPPAANTVPTLADFEAAPEGAVARDANGAEYTKHDGMWWKYGWWVYNEDMAARAAKDGTVVRWGFDESKP